MPELTKEETITMVSEKAIQLLMDSLGLTREQAICMLLNGLS
jgi:hypothetical protein